MLLLLSPVALLWLCLPSSLPCTFHCQIGFHRLPQRDVTVCSLVLFVLRGWWWGRWGPDMHQQGHPGIIYFTIHLFTFILTSHLESSCCCLSSNLNLHGENNSTFGCSFGTDALKGRGCVSSVLCSRGDKCGPGSPAQPGWDCTAPLCRDAEVLLQFLQNTNTLSPSGPKLWPERRWMDSNQLHDENQDLPRCYNLPKYFNNMN